MNAVLKQRNNAYGPPTQDFSRSAAILNTLGFRVMDAGGGLREIQPHHIALVQIAVKMSRLTWDPANIDSWMDIAGYAACGHECEEDCPPPVRAPAVAPVLEMLSRDPDH